LQARGLQGIFCFLTYIKERLMFAINRNYGLVRGHKSVYLCTVNQKDWLFNRVLKGKKIMFLDEQTTTTLLIVVIATALSIITLMHTNIR